MRGGGEKNRKASQGRKTPRRLGKRRLLETFSHRKPQKTKGYVLQAKMPDEE
jgi:hypothetical protein